MPTINLGVNFDSIKDADKFPLLPIGPAQFFVQKIEQTASKSEKNNGRPMLAWTLSFTHPEKGITIPLTYWTLLPWIRPGTTEIDLSGCGNLVAICKATGKPWAGTDIDTDAYLGSTGTANIIQSKRRMKDPNDLTGQKWIEDPNSDPQNDFDRNKPFVY